MTAQIWKIGFLPKKSARIPPIKLPTDSVKNIQTVKLSKSFSIVKKGLIMTIPESQKRETRMPIVMYLLYEFDSSYMFLHQLIIISPRLI